METMEHELKFLGLLGYRMEELKGYNKTRWVILDENDKDVGSIQRKKIIRKHKTKGPAVFGYVMAIDSDKITYKDTRRLDGKSGNYGYKFDIKRENNTDHVEMNCGESPSITIWSKEHGYMQFHIGFDSLFANFKSKTENFNTEEVVAFKWQKDDEMDTTYAKKYTYQIGYCDKAIELKDSNRKGITVREICTKYNSHHQEHNQLELEERTWINGKLRTNTKNSYDGTVKDAIKINEMGIDAISRFRYLLNSILPFKQEIMSTMLIRTPYVVEPGIELFLPDIIEELKEDPCLDCTTKGTCDMLEITEQNCITLKKHKQLTGKPYIKI